MLSSCLGFIVLLALFLAVGVFVVLCVGAAAMRKIDYPPFDPSEREEEV